MLLGTAGSQQQHRRSLPASAASPVARCPFPEQRHLLGRLPSARLGALAAFGGSPALLSVVPCHCDSSFVSLRLHAASASLRVLPGAATPRPAARPQLRRVGRSPQAGRAQDSGSLIRPMTLAATKETEPIAGASSLLLALLCPARVTCCDCMYIAAAVSSRSSKTSTAFLAGRLRSSDACLIRHLAAAQSAAGPQASARLRCVALTLGAECVRLGPFDKLP
jgi:hypothetical protein